MEEWRDKYFTDQSSYLDNNWTTIEKLILLDYCIFMPPPAHSAKTPVSQHAWPEPHMESMDIFKRMMRNSRFNNTDELKAQ